MPGAQAGQHVQQIEYIHLTVGVQVVALQVITRGQLSDDRFQLGQQIENIRTAIAVQVAADVHSGADQFYRDGCDCQSLLLNH